MVIGKACVYDGIINRGLGFDPMFFDCQENLLVLGVSIPETHVPLWNADADTNMINMTLHFVNKHL